MDYQEVAMRPHPITGKLFDQVHHATLPNGLTLLFAPMPFLKSVSLALSVKVGSRYESSTDAGVSHVLEHMLFQGTKKRDTREIARAITVVGGYLDASTSKENTAYYAQVPAEKLELAMDTIADLIRHPRLGTRELQKEKNVVLEEFRMVEDTPDDYIQDLFLSALWPRQALGRPILGSKTVLKNLRRAKLVRFWREHYHAENMTVAVAGNTHWPQLLRLAKKHFGAIQGGMQPSQSPPALPAAHPRVVVKIRDHEQVHACVGTYGIAFKDNRKYAALAFSQILGGGPHSRLFFEIRERAGLAYSIYSFVDFFQDTGVHGIYLACHPGKMELALHLVRREVRRLLHGKLTSKEVRDIKQQLRGNVILAEENPVNNMWSMIHEHEYLGTHLTQAEILAAIDGLDAQSIQAAGHAFFPPQGQFAAIVGPVRQGQISKLKTLVAGI
jgi:predicted Zn-dependent peptidase